MQVEGGVTFAFGPRVFVTTWHTMTPLFNFKIDHSPFSLPVLLFPARPSRFPPSIKLDRVRRITKFRLQNRYSEEFEVAVRRTRREEWQVHHGLSRVVTDD